jgi:hypothetical protein
LLAAGEDVRSTSSMASSEAILLSYAGECVCVREKV